MGAASSVAGCRRNNDAEGSPEDNDESSPQDPPANGTANAPISACDLENPPIACVDAHVDEINCLAVAPDKSLIASGSEDFSVRVWELEKFECVREMLGHRDYITCLTFAGQSLLSGSADTTVKKWDLMTGDCVFVS